MTPEAVALAVAEQVLREQHDLDGMNSHEEAKAVLDALAARGWTLEPSGLREAAATLLSELDAEWSYIPNEARRSLGDPREVLRAILDGRLSTTAAPTPPTPTAAGLDALIDKYEDTGTVTGHSVAWDLKDLRAALARSGQEEPSWHPCAGTPSKCYESHHDHQHRAGYHPDCPKCQMDPASVDDNGYTGRGAAPWHHKSMFDD